MESGSRVGNIKKKFEGLNESNVNSNSQFRHNFKKPVLSSDVRPNVKSEAPTDNISQENQFNNPYSSGSKGNIKRSHAFRSDKHIRPFPSQGNSSSSSSFVYTENNFCFSIKNNPNQQNKNVNETSCELQTAFNLVKNKCKEGHNSKIIEKIKNSCGQTKLINESVNLNTCISDFSKDICYSVVQKPLRLRHDKNVESTDLRIQDKSQVQSKSFLNTESRNLKCDGNRFSITSKLNFEQTQTSLEGDNLSKGSFVFSEQNLTNTLTEALKSPLPVGPPPKKPPRTFAHKCKSGNVRSLSDKTCLEKSKTADHVESRNINPSKPVIRPIRSKTESQIMLKKLELVLLHHQKNLGTSEKENCMEMKQTTFHSPLKIKRDNKGPLPNVPLPDEKVENKSFCFGSLNCSSSIEYLKSSNIYDTPFEPKSTFFVGKLNGSFRNMKTNTENEKLDNLYNKVHRSESEPLYAEPMHASNEPSAQVGERQVNILSLSSKNVNKLNDQSSNGLYYMVSKTNFYL